MTALDSEGRDETTVVVTREIAAEAAVWIARLHGPQRSPVMEKECLAWQARSAAHRLAFERCTEVWEAVPGVRLADAYASAAPRAGSDASLGGPEGSRRMLSIVAGLVFVAAGAFYVAMNGADSHVTKVGEQQLVLLDDGTRMTLNTDTEVRVKFRDAERSVSVERGEALFEVAKDAHRPFVVTAAGSEVVAVGTAFAVRLVDGQAHVGDSLAVTLIEGQVMLRPKSGLLARGAAPPKPVSMQAGERVLLSVVRGISTDASERVDRPNIDQLMAWKRSEAVFDDVSLQDAVAEMNRYSRTRVVLQSDAALANLRVSGLYRTGDTAGFAQAVATLHGLSLRERGGRLELALPPRAIPR